MEAIVEIKIQGKKELLKLTFDKYSFSVKADIDNQEKQYGEFKGVICSGYFYNKKEMVVDYHKSHFYFFIDEIKEKAMKIINKSKVLKS